MSVGHVIFLFDWRGLSGWFLYYILCVACLAEVYKLDILLYLYVYLCILVYLYMCIFIFFMSNDE